MKKKASNPKNQLSKLLETKRKQTKSSQKLQQESITIMNALADGLTLLNTNGKIEFVNPTFEKITGYKKNEVVGKNSKELIPKLLKPDDIKPVLAGFKNAFKGDVQSPQEFTLLAKSDKEIFITSTISFIKDINGKPKTIIWTVKDITEDKKIELRLKDIASKFKNFTETSDDLLFQLNRTGFIEYVSPSVQKLYGYHFKELVGQHLKKTTPVKEVPKALKALKSVLAGNPLSNFEINQIDKSGRKIPMEINAVPVKKNGKIVGLLGIMRNISERKKAEEELRASEEKYRALVENATDLIFMIDKKNNVLSLNKSAAKIFGKGINEVIGKSIFELFPEQVAAGYANNLKKVFKTGTPISTETKMITRGRESWISVSLSPVRDEKGKVSAVIGVTRDITENKKLEQERAEALKQAISGQVAHETIEGMIDPVALTDIKGRITRINKAFHNIFGYSEKEILGNFPSNFVIKNDVPRIVSGIKKVFKKGFISNFECTGLTKNKKKIPVLINFTLMKDDEGNPKGLIAVIRDITERKRADEELKEYSERLEEMVDERTLELRNSEAKYRNLTESLDELIYRADPETFVATYVNKAIEKIYGYTTDEWLSDPTLWERSLYPDDMERVYAEMEAAQQEMKYVNLTYRIIRRDKSVRWVEDHMSWQKDQQGNLISLNGVMNDITERKKAEQEVRLLSHVIEQTSEAVAVTDLKGKYYFINKSYEKMRGYSKEELMIKDFRETYTGNEKELKINAFKECLNNGFWTGELPYTRKDGSIVQTLASIVLLKDANGKPYAVAGTMKDITELKQLEDERTKAEAKAAAAKMAKDTIESMIDPVIIANLDGRIIQCNKAFTDIFEWGKEAIGKLLIEFVVEKDVPKVLKAFKKSIEKGHLKNFECTGLSKNKREIPILTSITLMKDIKGNPTGLIVVVRDITERKRAEEILMSSERELNIRNHIAKIFLTISDEEMYTEVLKVLLKAMDSKYGVFGYLDESSNLVVPTMTRTVWDKCQVPDKTFIFPKETWGDSSWPQAIREKRTICLNEQSTKTPRGHIAISRHISLPIIHQENVVGLLQVANKETDYNDEDIFLLETIGRTIAPVLNARLEKERQEKARKKAENERIQAVSERAAVLGAMGDGLLHLAMDGKILLVNPAFTKITGYKSNELEGKNVADLIPKWFKTEETEKIMGLLAKALAGKVPRSQILEWISKDGLTIPTSYTVSFKKDDQGKPISIIATIKDITELKQTEEKLRNSEQRYASIARNLPNGIVHIIDKDFRYVFSDGEEMVKLGLKNEDLIGKSIFDILAPETAQLVAENYERVLKGESRSFEGNFSGRTCYINAVPLPDANSEINNILVLSTNITELREAQEQLARKEKLATLGSSFK